MNKKNIMSKHMVDKILFIILFAFIFSVVKQVVAPHFPKKFYAIKNKKLRTTRPELHSEQKLKMRQSPHVWLLLDCI